MVTFVTLFLALVAGPHPVEVAVDGPVTRVEILLDGRRVAVLDGPPWRGVVDFGSTVLPHELVAVARSADGAELDRERQLVNLPRPEAEVKIAFVTGDDGMPRALRVIWENAENLEPLSIFATFDGRLLVPRGDGLYPLPAYDPEEVHLVSAEATFLDEVRARSDVTFGGRYGSDVATAITAVPIAVAGEPPPLADVEAALRAGGAPVRAAAIEQPRADVYMVRDFAATHRMALHRRRLARTATLLQRTGAPGDEEVSPDEDRLHLVVPNPRLSRGRALFPASAPVSIQRWRLPWLAANLTSRDAAQKGQSLLDAVAVAGVRAAGDGTPRAVLLVVTDQPADRSRFSVVEVRRYLRELRVPLHIWSLDGTPPGYGPTEDVTTFKGLSRAAARLGAELESQWIVWVEGLHMINRIELAHPLPGVRLAGVDDVASDESASDVSRRGREE